MPASLEFLESGARKTGYQAATLEKVVRLGEIASEISRHPTLSDQLALKGGTAINLCPGPPERLSVDLDFNFIGCADRSGMIEARPHVERSLRELLRRLGYRVQMSPDAAASRKIFANYRSALGPEDRVEVDINYLWRVPLAGLQRVTLWQPDPLERPTVLMVSNEELWTGKVLAFLDRTAPRDAWDMSRLGMSPILRQSARGLRRWCIAMSIILDRPLAHYARDRLAARLTVDAIKSQLHPMLGLASRPEPAELADGAWRVAAPLLSTERSEAEFLNLAMSGTLAPQLIFAEDTESAARFTSHPQVAWKMQNLLRHLRKQP